MAFHFGRNDKIGITQEATYNAAWAAPAAATGTWLHTTTFEFNSSIEAMRSGFATGQVYPKTTEIVRGVRGITGHLEMLTHKNELAWLILNSLGKVTTTTVASKQKHIFILSGNTPKSVAFVVQHPETGLARQYQVTGCAITKAVLSWKMNEPIMLACDFTGADFAEAAVSGSPTYNPTPTSSEPYFKYPVSALTWNINSATAWGNVTITFDFNYADSIEESYEGGSLTRKRLERAANDQAPCKITGVAQRVYTGNSLYGVFNADTSFEAYYRDILTPDGSSYHLGVNMAVCRPLDYKHIKRSNGLVDEQITFEAVSNLDTAYTDNDFNITLVDDQTNPATQTP